MNYPAITAYKYHAYPGRPTLVFDAITKALTDRASEVDWPAFTPDDWRLLTIMAKTEGVAPLLYNAFKGFNVQTLNVGTFNVLQKEYYSTAAYNALLFSELERVLAALNAADIPVILLKGAALAQTLYPDPALRPMSDLDVLVPFEEVDHAVQAAQELGYRGDDALSYWPSLERVLGHHEHLQNEKGVNLELHWSLTQAFNGDHTLTDWFWRHTQPLRELRAAPPGVFPRAEPSPLLSFPGGQALSPTSHVMYLSTHLFLQHGAARGLLLWLYDLHLLLTRYGEEIDWEALLARSRHLGWGAPLAAALSQIRDVFQTEIPPEVLEFLHAHQDARSQGWVAYKSRLNQSRAWMWWQKWRTLTWRGRLAYGLGNVFPSPAFIRRRYAPNPAWLWPWYYFYRWGDMAVEAVRYVLR